MANNQIKFKVLTSAYFPPRPNIVFSSRTSVPQLFPTPSSSMRLVQSVCPVDINTCCVYGAIVALSGREWSMGRPSGIGGVGAQSQVGSGHVEIVGNGGGGGGVRNSGDDDDNERKNVRVCKLLPLRSWLFTRAAWRDKDCVAIAFYNGNIMRSIRCLP
jgi:hypothetical protein